MNDSNDHVNLFGLVLLDPSLFFSRYPVTSLLVTSPSFFDHTGTFNPP